MRWLCHSESKWGGVSHSEVRIISFFSKISICLKQITDDVKNIHIGIQNTNVYLVSVALREMFNTSKAIHMLAWHRKLVEHLWGEG